MLHSSYKFCRFVLPVIVITETFCFFSCASVRLISNSNGYDYNTNPEISLIKENPDWLNKGMYQETLLDGNYYYVVGSYIGNTKKPNADKADVAESEAAIDAKKKLAEFLSSDVTTNSSSMMSGENRVKEMSFNGKNSTLSQGEYYDSLYTDTYVESTASFSGLALNDRFFSLFEDTEENKRYYNYWCRFRISEKDLKKAQEEMKNKKDLTRLEIERYNDLKSSTLRTIQFLKNCNFLENEEQFKSLYFELVNYSAELRGLDYFNKLDLESEEKKEYDELIKQITEILEEYNPTDIQKQQYLYRIRTLEKALQERDIQIGRLDNDVISLKSDHNNVLTLMERQIAEKEAENTAIRGLVNNLEQNISELQKKGIHLVSTNVFAVYPGKPEFSFSGDGFSLSGGAVTNREFISYLTMTGNPDYSLAEEGLESPVSLSFLDCVEYCNWLSRLYSLPEFYSVKNGAVQCNNNGGYRLPFEGELAEAASAGFSFPPEFAGLSLWSCTPLGTAGTLCRIENGTGEIRRFQTPAEGILACLVITRSNN